MKLIAGIDPGTKVGWAVLDLDGKIVAMGSQKELDKDVLISKLVQQGRVIAIGTDKAKIPGLVREVATKLGAKVIAPSEDVLVDEKRKVTQNIGANAHETDAFASALLAHRKLIPLLTKVRSFLVRENKSELFEQVIEIVLKEEISIHAAISILTPKEEAIEVRTGHEERNDDVAKLYRMLVRSRKENAQLQAQMDELERKKVLLEKKVREVQEKSAVLVKPKTPKEISRIKDAQIQSLDQRYKNMMMEREQARKERAQLEQIVAKNTHALLPHLARLGVDEVSRVEHLIRKGMPIFVHDPNEVSAKAIDMLKKKEVQLVVSERAIGLNARKQIPFACIVCKEFTIVGNLVAISNEFLERSRRDRAVLSQIIEAYQSERSLNTS